ncbi:hypothetical protein GBA52_000456, partial [Prunus armeniaca]
EKIFKINNQVRALKRNEDMNSEAMLVVVTSTSTIKEKTSRNAEENSQTRCSNSITHGSIGLQA